MSRVSRTLGMGAVATAFLAIAYFVIDNDNVSNEDIEVTVPTDPVAFSLSDLINGRNSFENVNVIPMFRVRALGFKAVDESGIDFFGSDEVIAIWDANNSTGANTYEYGDVDSGESRTFLQGQSCIYPINSDRFINGNSLGPDGKYKGWVYGGGVRFYKPE